jgi:signal transduction histidine kinase
VLAILPTSIVGAPIPHPYYEALSLGALLFSVIAVYRGTLVAMDAARKTGEALERMREEVLVTATTRARSLEAIGSKVAHELKNPLASIKGLAQLLARGAKDERSIERFHVMESEVARMEVILRDYLSFSRPLEEIRPEEVNLGSLCADVRSIVEARAEGSGVSVAQRGSAVVSGDPRRLKEALLNLVSNAIEATPAGGHVRIAVRASERGAEIGIEDTGSGIAPDVLARVGTPFFTTREGGTGLGALLARTIVVQHGGEVRYESVVGRGTKVTVMLPRSLSCDHSKKDADGKNPPG